jgi:hypothetical protein
VLSGALEALAPHRIALLVPGAQGVYLRTGLNEIGIAPYTTDGGLASAQSRLRGGWSLVPSLERGTTPGRRGGSSLESNTVV